MAYRQMADSTTDRSDGLQLLSDIARQASTVNPPAEASKEAPPLAQAQTSNQAAEERLYNFLVENGINNDLLVQCGATQQTIKLSPRQMYEVLTSTMHASKSQQMFAHAQTPAQWSSSGQWAASSQYNLQEHREDGVPQGHREEPRPYLPQHPQISVPRQDQRMMESVLSRDQSYSIPQDHLPQYAGQCIPFPHANQNQRHAPVVQHVPVVQHAPLVRPVQPQVHAQPIEPRQEPSRQEPSRGTKRTQSETTSGIDMGKYRGAPDDGYRWRKYGEKAFSTEPGRIVVKSYFRCCHKTCSMRKQVEKGHEGTKIRLVGDGHNHEPLGLRWSSFPPQPIDIEQDREPSNKLTTKQSASGCTKPIQARLSEKCGEPPPC